MVRALLIVWAAAIGYYALRVTVWAVPDSCPDTVWESTEDPRCGWNAADLTWLISLPVLALTTIVVLLILAGRQIKKTRRR
jgi:hypothetical protein